MFEMQSSTSKGYQGKAVWIVGSFLVGLLVALLDQFTKSWIRANLKIGQSLFDFGFFRITYIRNSGAAFGLFPDYSLLLTVFSIIGIVLLILLALASHRLFFLKDGLSRFTLGLFLGGTVGNLLDRFIRGYVTDFIDFSFWPAFNIADSAITIGVIIFAFSLIRLTRNAQS